MKNRNMLNAVAVIGLLAIMMLWAAPVSATPGDGNLDLVVLRTDPSPAVAGQYFDLLLKVENTGTGYSEDVKIELLPEYPFYLDPQEEAIKEYGTLPIATPLEVKYKIRVDENAIDGINKLTVEYSSKDGAKKKQELNIEVEQKDIELALGSINSQPAKIVSDLEDAKLEIEIMNVGDADAKLATSKLMLPDGFSTSSSYSDIDNLGTIAEDGSSVATYYIDVDEDVDDGKYNATLRIRYKDDTGSESEYMEEMIGFDIPVMGKPKFEIKEAVTSPKRPMVGQKDAKLEFSIENTGSKKAESVSVRVLKKSDQPLSFAEKTDYIGTMDATTIGEAVLEFDVDEGAAAKQYLMEMEIRYIYEDTVYVDYSTVPVDVVPAKERSNNNTGVALGVIAIAAIAYLARGRFMKSKEAKR